MWGEKRQGGRLSKQHEVSKRAEPTDLCPPPCRMSGLGLSWEGAALDEEIRPPH